VAKGSVAFLFIAVTNVAGLEEGRAFLACLINCLVWDLLLMTKELQSLLLSPCSNRTEQLRKLGRFIATT
jgi:hypothetical protein